MDAIPIAVFWSVALWAFLQRRQALLYLFFGSMAFGSFAAIPTGLTGGLTLTPTPIVAALLIARQFNRTRGLSRALDAAMRPAALAALFLFWLVAGMATLFMPRFFAGQVMVISLALGQPALLGPTTQNIAQFLYLSISVLLVFALSQTLRDPAMRRHAMGALCLGAAMTAATGLLDLASSSAPLGPLLEVFRTASYALLTEDEILGGKRVVGLMPEASAFGGLAVYFLAALYFFRRVMAPGFLRERIVPALIVLLALLAWMSTSSAAYVALGVFCTAAVVEWSWRLLLSGRNPYLRRGLAREFCIGSGAACLLLVITLASPRILGPALEVLDLMVFQKTASSSFEERSMWTQVSWEALVATHGLGVGAGGTRASNFAVALASNVGLLGAALYLVFLVQIMLLRKARRSDLQGQALLSAIRFSFIAPLCAALLVGTTPDFGLFNAFLFALAAAVSDARPHSPKHAPRRLAVGEPIDARWPRAAGSVDV